MIITAYDVRSVCDAAPDTLGSIAAVNPFMYSGYIFNAGGPQKRDADLFYRSLRKERLVVISVKKYAAFCIIAVVEVCLLLLGWKLDIIKYLPGMTDPYYGERPYDYGNAKWVCDSYNVWFEIDVSNEDIRRQKGEIEIDGVVYPCIILFAMQTDIVDIYIDYPLEALLFNAAEMNNGIIAGECDFSPETLVIHVDREKDTLLNGKYETLTFHREELSGSISESTD